MNQLEDEVDFNNITLHVTYLEALKMSSSKVCTDLVKKNPWAAGFVKRFLSWVHFGNGEKFSPRFFVGHRI